MKDSKAKAFLSAFQALFSSDSDDNNTHNDAPLDDNHNENQDDDDYHHGFLSMLGSLRDLVVDFLVPTSASSSVKSIPYCLILTCI